MFILEKNEGNKQVYYTSSSHFYESIKGEAEQIKPFINQLFGQNVADDIKAINPSSKQDNNYDCGVFLIKYIEEMLETGNLTLTRNITEQDCQEFRKE